MMAILFLVPFPSSLLSKSMAYEVVLIANKSINSNRISSKDIKNIFLGKKKKLGNDKIIVAMLKTGELNKKFLKAYVGKSGFQLKNVWKKLLFAGKAKMPKIFKSEQEMLRYVTVTKGAIGYINSDIISDEIKVIGIYK